MTDDFKAFAYSLAKCDRNKLLNDSFAEFVFKAGVKAGRTEYENILKIQRDYYRVKRAEAKK